MVKTTISLQFDFSTTINLVVSGQGHFEVTAKEKFS